MDKLQILFAISCLFDGITSLCVALFVALPLFVVVAMLLLSALSFALVGAFAVLIAIDIKDLKKRKRG